MTQKSKAISVKIATVKVIKALETTLAKLEKDYAAQAVNEAKFEKLQAKWNKDVVKFALDNFSKAINLRTNYRSYNNLLNVDFDIDMKEHKTLTDEPERDFEKMNKYEFDNQKNELGNAIRILKMTDEETVSTSTYNAIARYL